MINLPSEFISYTEALFGPERWQRYLNAFNEPSPVSIRLNPFKALPISSFSILHPPYEPVPWCRNAFYLSERPNFTLDPLLHAGAYYVQEASSMFLDYILQNVLDYLQYDGRVSERLFLDLCAAPGGKSTLLRAALPDEFTLYSNEPDHRRANILMENLQKQGHPKVIVTNNYPNDYRKSGLLFDLILTDVPCSGEGMFRKDGATIKEWSLQNVMKCQALQRSIVEDIWPCLREGGILIYSTCTFNTREDEENVRWIKEELGAEIIHVKVNPQWNITGSLLKDFNEPVYRFLPGTTRGEGLFMAVLIKKGGVVPFCHIPSAINHKLSNINLHIMSNGHYEGTLKGKNLIPAHAESLLTTLEKEKYPNVELTLEQAQHYLHHEAIVLSPKAPRGFVIVKYKNLPLGFVKNIGNRANNLYPPEWKIRNL